MASPKTGARMNLYYSATFATPSWQLISEVEDVSIPDFTMGMAELKRRSSAYTKNLPTLIQTVSVEFKLWHGLGATAFGALRGYFLAGTAIAIAIMDGPVATPGSEGWKVPMLVEQFPWDQALEDVSSHDIRLVLAYMEDPAGTEVNPSWLTVS
jgi:hypothetical protein